MHPHVYWGKINQGKSNPNRVPSSASLRFLKAPRFDPWYGDSTAKLRSNYPTTETTFGFRREAQAMVPMGQGWVLNPRKKPYGSDFGWQATTSSWQY
jgi:hypothetical protein